MSTPLANSNRPNLTDWLRLQLKWVTVPSWLLSGVFHFALGALVVFFSQLPSCRADIAGDEGESFRKVGIHVKSEQAEETEVEQSPAAADVTYADPFEVTEAVPELTPPVAPVLPTTEIAPPRIGVANIPLPTTVGANDLLQPNSALAQSTDTGVANPVSGGTSFMGLKDVGKKFVYVIDKSTSMGNDNAFAAAKAELLASLQHLDKTQQFLIIFYSTTVDVLTPRDGRFDMFWGTDSQRLQVSGQLQSVREGGGTRHLPALTKALEARPDVIYFLTDGDAETALTAGEIDEVKRRCRGTRINCVEFGRLQEAPIQGQANFLQKLADETQGQYRYINVRR